MLHPSTQKLIDRLAEMTAQKKIDWAEADETGGVVYATEGYAVILTANPPHVSLTTENGRLLEEAGETALSDTPHEGQGTYAELVRSVTEEAARVARGTEAAIDALLAGIDGQAGNRRKAAGATAQTAGPADPATASPEPDAPLDASVPEAALIEEEVEEPAFEQADTDYDEDDVSGAVARLADEVNGTPASQEPESAEAPDEAAAENAGEPVEAFSVTPEDAPHIQDVEQVEEIADASAGPVVSEDIETTPGDVWDEAGPDAGEAAPAPREAFSRYVPFGLGGIEAAGAEVSANGEEPEADLDSQLGAASAGMDLDPEPASEGEPGEPPMSIPLDLRPLASKFTFASPGDWTPAPGSYSFSAPAGAAPAAPVIEDADETGSLPDIGALTGDEEEASETDTASADDVDAVSPPASAAGSEADEDLFEDSPYSEDMDAAEEESRPVKKRRKSRFNPWS